MIDRNGFLRRLLRRARINWSQIGPKTSRRGAIFSDVYQSSAWGGAGQSHDFDSGTGSEQAAITGPYVRAVRDFIQAEWPTPPRVVDLGCGDFRVGSRLSDLASHYVGVDVVPALIERNRRVYPQANVSFECRDIVADPLPEGDLCLVRQVLQHLSNEDIQKVLPKLARFKEVLITEHIPSEARIKSFNRKKRTGPEIRLYWGSGVFLDRAPFSIDSARLSVLLSVPGHAVEPGGDPGRIVTYRLRGGNAA